MRPATEIVKAVRQTEKGTRLAPHGQYLVDVALDANKVEVRRAVEELFQVKVRRVNTHINHGKWRRIQAQWGRRTDRKVAIVSLEEGQKIEVAK
jgi:large subunit ribosomal protein L23